eukprot:TRINITY_DN26524_c0_g1_i1.p1 TRINITY_DN26524_c0_g1~~TRINITY_DN26524_c0_g1_i1.p1  ORF type:complete len:100 (-),score=14.48 TRINITY_DN26524_c0_g1_i1:13-312(-)
MLTEMEAMPELAEIKSEIGGVDFGAHGTSVPVGSNSTTPQPHTKQLPMGPVQLQRQPLERESWSALVGTGTTISWSCYHEQSSNFHRQHVSTDSNSSYS